MYFIFNYFGSILIQIRPGIGPISGLFDFFSFSSGCIVPGLFSKIYSKNRFFFKPLGAFIESFIEQLMENNKDSIKENRTKV